MACQSRTALTIRLLWLLTILAITLPVAMAATSTPARETGGQGSAEEGGDLRHKSVQQAALRLARRAMAEYLKTRKTIKAPGNLPAALRRRAGVFVTIEKRGRITPRGCRGTLTPVARSLAEEIIRNAIAACTRDQSEPPLRAGELPKCLISLTVVQRIEPLQSIAGHDAENNGLIAQSGGRIGIILPYEGRDAATQLRWAKRKAGLPDGANVQLRELYAVRFREG